MDKCLVKFGSKLASNLCLESLCPKNMEVSDLTFCSLQLFGKSNIMQIAGILFYFYYYEILPTFLFLLVLFVFSKLIGYVKPKYCSGPGFALHSEIVAPYLMHYGSEEQQERFLPKMCSGEIITAIAMTEPGAGSDLQGMKTTAVPDGDDFLLSGSKTYITNGAMADMVIGMIFLFYSIFRSKTHFFFIILFFFYY